MIAGELSLHPNGAEFFCFSGAKFTMSSRTVACSNDKPHVLWTITGRTFSFNADFQPDYSYTSGLEYPAIVLHDKLTQSNNKRWYSRLELLVQASDLPIEVACLRRSEIPGYHYFMKINSKFVILKKVHN